MSKFIIPGVFANFGIKNAGGMSMQYILNQYASVLRAVWTGDSVEGSTVIDMMGAYNGTLHGATIVNDDKKRNCFSLTDGNYIQGAANIITRSIVNTTHGGAGYTVFLWVKPNNIAVERYLMGFQMHERAGLKITNSGAVKFEASVYGYPEKTVSTPDGLIDTNWHLIELWHAVNGLVAGSSVSVKIRVDNEAWVNTTLDTGSTDDTGEFVIGKHTVGLVKELFVVVGEATDEMRNAIWNYGFGV